MGEIRVMDRSGDRNAFRWGGSREEIDEAEKIFNRYVKQGFTMYRLTRDGERGRIMAEFDAGAHGILAVPRMVGG